jgi:hypothetical protein
MKKSQLVQLIKEELKGYSKYAPGGTTKGGTSKEYMDILTKIAKSGQEEKPNSKNESMFSPNFVTNLRPKGSYDELVNVNVYKNEEGGYSLSLSVYTTSGFGMAATTQLKFSDQAIPMEQFTADHVIERVGTVYMISKKGEQELRDFVNGIPTSLP